MFSNLFTTAMGNIFLSLKKTMASRRSLPALLILFCSLLQALAVSFCTTLYDSPDPASCDRLLHGDDLSSGYTGISNTDRTVHLFALSNLATARHQMAQQSHPPHHPLKRKISLINTSKPSLSSTKPRPIPSPLQLALLPSGALSSACVSLMHGRKSGVGFLRVGVKYRTGLPVRVRLLGRRGESRWQLQLQVGVPIRQMLCLWAMIV